MSRNSTRTQVPATMTRAEAIERLGVSSATVDRWRKNGILVDVPQGEPGPGNPPVREVRVYAEHVEQIIMKRGG